jgi:hypothetical protein
VTSRVHFTRRWWTGRSTSSRRLLAGICWAAVIAGAATGAERETVVVRTAPVGVSTASATCE